MLTLGQTLPKTIDEPEREDRIEEGDSDEENLHELAVDGGLKLIEQIEANNVELKERRSKKIVKNPERDMKNTIEKTLKAAKEKAVGEFVGKVREANRWAERPENRFIIWFHLISCLRLIFINDEPV